MVKRETQELSPDAVTRITRLVRSLADDRVDRGIDVNRPMQCDSCGQEKSASGASVYGAYKLCNDCLLDFTLALAGNEVANVAEFMTRKTDDGNPPPDLSGHRERPPLSLNPLQGRDKLMPSNETA